MVHLAHLAPCPGCKPLFLPLITSLAERFHPRPVYDQTTNLPAYTKLRYDLLVCFGPGGVATQRGGYHMSLVLPSTSQPHKGGWLWCLVEWSHLRQAASSKHEQNRTNMHQAHSQDYRTEMEMEPKGDEHAMMLHSPSRTTRPSTSHATSWFWVNMGPSVSRHSCRRDRGCITGFSSPQHVPFCPTARQHGSELQTHQGHVQPQIVFDAWERL
ncbi:hypothetical protein F5883DRAFT_43367 [Diaporthe sp. PMI_573]|nr:hypothetical protein F5883DRAFT_43367 [Diaporthaceae sp. PMI_573]